MNPWLNEASALSASGLASSYRSRVQTLLELKDPPTVTKAEKSGGAAQAPTPGVWVVVVVAAVVVVGFLVVELEADSADFM